MYISVLCCPKLHLLKSFSFPVPTERAFLDLLLLKAFFGSWESFPSSLKRVAPFLPLPRLLLLPLEPRKDERRRKRPFSPKAFQVEKKKEEGAASHPGSEEKSGSREGGRL